MPFCVRRLSSLQTGVSEQLARTTLIPVLKGRIGSAKRRRRSTAEPIFEYICSKCAPLASDGRDFRNTQ